MTSHINNSAVYHMYMIRMPWLGWNMTWKYMCHLISMCMKRIMMRVWWPGMRWLGLTTETREGGHGPDVPLPPGNFQVSGFVLQHNSPDTFTLCMAYFTVTKMGLCGSVARLVCCDSDGNKQVTKKNMGPVAAAGAANSGSECGVCAQCDSSWNKQVTKKITTGPRPTCMSRPKAVGALNTCPSATPLIF